MNEFELALIKALTYVGESLSEVAKSIDNVPSNDNEISEAGNSIERGLADLATAVGNLEVNR